MSIDNYVQYETKKKVKLGGNFQYCIPIENKQNKEK